MIARYHARELAMSGRFPSHQRVAVKDSLRGGVKYPGETTDSRDEITEHALDLRSLRVLEHEQSTSRPYD